MTVSEPAAADLPSAHPFDEAMRLAPSADGTLRGTTSEAYWNFTGPFGGVTAAILLRAALMQPQRIGTPLSITVNFCAPLAKGDFSIGVREARTNRSTQHWSMELSQPGLGIAATATAAFAVRRDTWGHQSAAPPDAPAPETLPPLPTEGLMAWLQRYRFKFAKGQPFRPGGQPSAEVHSPLSHVWVNDDPPRPVDHLSLLSLTDTFFGRIFHARGVLVPIGTVSMTTYFLGTEEELAAHGAEPLLGVADAKTFHKGYFDQSAELWSRSGRLLATSTQIVYFRD